MVRALKNKSARHALTEDLRKRAASNKSMLDHQQFLLVVKLLNSLLQNESSLDENGIAAQIVPLGDTFYRVSHAAAAHPQSQHSLHCTEPARLSRHCQVKG